VPEHGVPNVPASVPDGPRGGSTGDPGTAEPPDWMYRLLVESIRDYAIFALDPAGNVSTWSAGAARLKGYTRPEILGRHFSVFYPPEAIAVGKPGRELDAAARSGRVEEEGWRLRKDGSRFWASVVITALRDTTGTLVGFAKVTRDLTERHRAEEALRESESRFRLLVESVRDYAIFMLDPQGRVATWNAGAERIQGYRAEEIVGRHFSTFYTEEEKALGLPQQALETAETEGKYEAEGWRVRKDGSRYWAHVVIDAIHDEVGRLVGFAKITRDVTERREAQRKLDETRQQLIHSQKLETIGQLTGGVAHDFNNLLAVVIGNLELLKKRIPDDPKLARLVETALKGAHRGASLTSRMLSFARKQDLKPEAIDVPKLVADTTDLLQRSLGPKVRIETHFPLHLSAAHVDGNQFELALVNLAVNARDAMPDGGVLTLSARDATIAPDDPRAAPEVLAHGGLAPGPYVVVSVSDTGVGMDAETLSRAVEPFFTTKGIGKGTGLGLSMVHGLAAQSGGGLVLKSTPGKGTTVEIWLPVDSSRAEVGPDSQAGAGRDPAAPLDILVVDDDALVLMATAALIEDLGHRVTEAYSASEALSVLRGGRRFDLVLTDEAMPGMTGSALARRIREEWPRLPVVIGTGYAEPPDTLDQRLPRISKPFDQRTLAQTFETVIGRAMGAGPAPAPSRADRPVSAPIGSG
jgi:PAS domain S-box-containing protein